MNHIFQEDDLETEQLNYINNEYFSGFKRYKNWKTLPPKLKLYLPKFVQDRQSLQIKLEGLTRILKKRINITYQLLSEIPTHDRIDENVSKLLSVYRNKITNGVTKDNETSLINSYIAVSDNDKLANISSTKHIIEHLKLQFDQFQNTNAQLRQVENTLTLCISLINQYADDKDGVKYKKVKKTDIELSREAKDKKCQIDKLDQYKDVRIVRNANECATYLKDMPSNSVHVEDYIEKCSKKLIDVIHNVHSSYALDNRPWVIGYSGGKDSSAVATLVYLSMLAMKKELRNKNIYLVASDTLVETPKVVDHIDNSLNAIHKHAIRNELPISSNKVLPEANQSFWACLLGKGYPAPTKSFRWCTERMKINPVSDFIKNKISQHNEVIVTLGSRSEESASRAQVIKKHKLENSRFARHTTLANAFIYTPIDTWSVDDVWKILRSCSLEVTISPLGIGKKWSDDYDIEWENPWAAKNLTLWNLYKDASDQGECPMVIDDSTPSCGNSRFGCWTCTVVTKDRAMESLIKNGEEWMSPLLEFRNKLAFTSIPENKEKFRNHKRRIGKVNFQRAKDGQELSEERSHVPGPYWLRYRKEWLKELLVQEKQFNEDGHTIELITEPELHAIRQEWINDPNEPDWNDSLPQIYRDVYGKDLDWVINDNSTFDYKGAQILAQLGEEHDIAPEMVMKLLDLEISMEGLSRRTGVQNKIGTILKQDWGTLEQIKEKQEGMQSKAAYDVFQQEIEVLDSKLADIDKLMSKEF